MRKISGIYVLAFLLAYEAVHRYAAYGGLGLVLDFLLGLGGAVPVAEQELARLDLLLELIPAVALLYIRVSESEGFGVHIILDVVKQGADVFCNALQRHSLFLEGVSSGHLDSACGKVSGAHGKSYGHSFELPFGELESRPEGVAVVNLAAYS